MFQLKTGRFVVTFPFKKRLSAEDWLTDGHFLSFPTLKLSNAANPPPLLPLPVPFLFRPGGGGGGEEEEEEEDADCFPLSCFSFRVSLCFSLNDSCVRFLEDTFKFRLIDPFSYRLDRVAPRKPQLLRAIPREIPDSGKCFWIPADIPLNFD